MTQHEHHLSERTPIKLGAVASCLVVLAGGIFWCATINTKVDIIMEEVKSISRLENKVTDHESRIKQLEQGSKNK